MGGSTFDHYQGIHLLLSCLVQEKKINIDMQAGALVWHSSINTLSLSGTFHCPSTVYLLNVYHSSGFQWRLDSPWKREITQESCRLHVPHILRPRHCVVCLLGPLCTLKRDTLNPSGGAFAKVTKTPKFPGETSRGLCEFKCAGLLRLLVKFALLINVDKPTFRDINCYWYNIAGPVESQVISGFTTSQTCTLTPTQTVTNTYK